MNLFIYFALRKAKKPVFLELVAKWNKAKGFNIHTTVVVALVSMAIGILALLGAVIIIANLKTTLGHLFSVDIALLFIGVISIVVSMFYFWRFGDFCIVVKHIVREVNPHALYWDTTTFYSHAREAMNAHLKKYADELRELEARNGNVRSIRKEWESFAEFHLDLFELIPGIKMLSFFKGEREP